MGAYTKSVDHFVTEMLKVIIGTSPSYKDYEDVHIIQKIGNRSNMVLYKNKPFGWLTISKDENSSDGDKKMIIEFKKI